MGKVVSLTEEQLRNLVENSIKEAIDEVSWFQRAGQGLRNAWDNTKNQIGGAAAGVKDAVRHGGGLNGLAAGRNDYLAKKNGELAQSRQEECDAAVAEFRKEYGKRVGELNRWKASEIRQIKQMYGADAFAKKASDAAANAEAARDDQAKYWGYSRNKAAGQEKMVAESIDRIVNNVLKEYLSR